MIAIYCDCFGGAAVLLPRAHTLQSLWKHFIRNKKRKTEVDSHVEVQQPSYRMPYAGDGESQKKRGKGYKHTPDSVSFNFAFLFAFLFDTYPIYLASSIIAIIIHYVGFLLTYDFDMKSRLHDKPNISLVCHSFTFVSFLVCHLQMDISLVSHCLVDEKRKKKIENKTR